MTRRTSNGLIEFRFCRPGVSLASVVGDWSGSEGGSLMMQWEGSGWWKATARLPAGEYRFRYLADGQWFTDFASHGVEPHEPGWDSLLVVPELIEKYHAEREAA
jgi:hypothetical protein